MYFASRMQAGRMLASQLVKKYRYEDCAVIALNDGGVVVGAQIATELHSILMLLMSKDIKLPRELEAIGAIAQDGSFTYNHAYSDGERAELASEYFGFIEQEKLNSMHDLHQLIGSGGIIRKDYIKGRNIIVVTDGFPDGFALDIALEYLKPVAVQKIIVATPLASVNAVDRMHVLADDIYCLSVVADYIDTDHYFNTHDIPDHDKIIETIEKIILDWK